MPFARGTLHSPPVQRGESRRRRQGSLTHARTVCPLVPLVITAPVVNLEAFLEATRNARKSVHCLGSVGIREDHVTPALTSKFQGPEVLGFVHDPAGPGRRAKRCRLLFYGPADVPEHG